MRLSNEAKVWKFRPYCVKDQSACLAIFDANCPLFFAPQEREDYATFLLDTPADYEVCESADVIAAAFGLLSEASDTARLVWIMTHPERQGRGLGTQIMRRVLQQAGMRHVLIAASHKSADFFARFGATVVGKTADGWGPGMHRIDMEIAR